MRSRSLLSLDEPAALDSDLTGVKASKLAQARANGLPVLPGWIVPVAASRAAIRLGAETLERSGSVAAACLAVSSAGVQPDLRHGLKRAALEAGGSSIVRSSTPLDGDPRWAGAFSTYLDVGDEDLATAVSGCWASMFTRDVTDRSRALGVRAWERGMGVFLQPYVPFERGGTAIADADGTVRIVAARGGPAGILGGSRSGLAVESRPDGPEGDDGVLQDVASLARTILRVSGDDLIEWGATSTEVVVLQVGAREPSRATVSGRRPIEGAPPAALRLATAAARFRGALGEALVLPWASTLERLPEPAAPVADDAARAVQRAMDLAGGLTRQAWGGPRVPTEIESTFRQVLGPQPDVGFQRLSRLGSVCPADAAHLVALVESAGRRLFADRRLPHPRAIWRCRPEELAVRIASSAALPVGMGADRWEPFIFGIVAGEGDGRDGAPAAPGIGVGKIAVVRGSGDDRPEPRSVLVLPAPIPHVAPLLWECAAVVCARGSEGAHLFEVARSCGVPAIVGVDLRRVDGDALVAVDGNAGRVMTWHPSTRDHLQRGA